MKAVVIHAAKDLRVGKRDVGVPGPGEVAIAIKAGGICGSDLHYYNHGGFGAIKVREPMILGHEVAGEVTSVGEGVSSLAVGDRVAVSPSRPCNACTYCLEGKQQHCLNMRFYGSAMPMPHIQGAFAQHIVAHDWQCHEVDEGVLLSKAVFAEPFAVTLHAVQRAGSVFGKNVLITGAGPIGTLCAVAARNAGAAKITITDVQDAVLEKAKQAGADRTVNVANDDQFYRDAAANKGTFDVVLEASGNEAALRAALEVVRPQGTIVQLGLGGDISLPMNAIVAKEIALKGSFRFHEEFGQAVDLINRGAVDLDVLHTGTFDIDDAVAAFEAAGDRSQHMKVQLAF